MVAITKPRDHAPPEPALARLSGAGLRTFFNIADVWKLTTVQAMTLLGLDSRSTYFKWKRDPDGAKLTRDTLERLSYVFGIFKALEVLLPRAESADQWVHRPNQAAPFGGRSALDVMLGGRVSDLYRVRQYLDAERG